MNHFLKGMCCALSMFAPLAYGDVLSLGQKEMRFCINTTTLPRQSVVDTSATDPCAAGTAGYKEVFLPYETWNAVEGATIKKLLISVHPSGSNWSIALNPLRREIEDRLLASSNTATQNEGKAILVVAPQFLDKGAVDQLHVPATDTTPEYNVPGRILRWGQSTSTAGWAEGTVSVGRVSVSSFDIMDSLIRRLVPKVGTIEEVIVMGFSRGSKYVNRYSIGTHIEDEYLDAEDNPTTTFRYASASAGSYMYFNDERYVQTSSGWEVRDPKGVVEVVDVEGEAPITKDCSVPAQTTYYNRYPFGTASIPTNHYMNDHLGGITSPQAKANALSAHVENKRRLFVVGDEDIDPQYGETCAEDILGPDRIERTKAYYLHLGKVETGLLDPHENDNAGCCIVSGVDHSQSVLRSGPVYRFWRFNTFACGSDSKCHP